MVEGRFARTGVLLLAATAATGIAGCTGSGNNQTGAGGPTTTGGGAAVRSTASSRPPASSAPPSSTGQARGLIAAGNTAVHAVPHATVISIEAERHGTVWETQVVTPDGTEHEVDVAANGTKIVSGPSAKHENQKDKAKHRKRVQAAKLDYRHAARTALSAVPNAKKVSELDLDTYHGTTVWEADVQDRSNTKHEVKINAVTGTVVANETG
jgi:uncharacterized membrane protein YkoI